MTTLLDRSKDNFDDRVDLITLVNQINRMTLASISGGRVIRRATGVTLPVGSGYDVEIDLQTDDYYTVRRVFRRGSKTFLKGERAGVDCFELSEAAYYASCFRSYDETEWTQKR